MKDSEIAEERKAAYHDERQLSFVEGSSVRLFSGGKVLSRYFYPNLKEARVEAIRRAKKSLISQQTSSTDQ